MSRRVVEVTTGSRLHFGLFSLPRHQADALVGRVSRTVQGADGIAALVAASAVTGEGLPQLREALAHAAGKIARDLVLSNFVAGDQTRLVQGFVEKLGEEARR